MHSQGNPRNEQLLIKQYAPLVASARGTFRTPIEVLKRSEGEDDG